MKSTQSALLALIAASAVAAYPNQLVKRLDLGSCANPAIEFGPGFDGRTEDSFQPVDRATFNHGSAQKIGIISEFICDRLRDQCQAGADAQAACAQAEVDSAALTGQAAGKPVPICRAPSNYQRLTTPYSRLFQQRSRCGPSGSRRCGTRRGRGRGRGRRQWPDSRRRRE